MSRIVQESDGDAVQAHMGDKNACARLGNSLINLEAVCGDVCKVLEDKKPEVVSPETLQAGDNGEAGVPELKKEAPQVKDGVKAEAHQVGDGAETNTFEVKNEALQVGDSVEAEDPEGKSEVVSDDAKDELEPMEE